MTAMITNNNNLISNPINKQTHARSTVNVHKQTINIEEETITHATSRCSNDDTQKTRTNIKQRATGNGAAERAGNSGTFSGGGCVQIGLAHDDVLLQYLSVVVVYLPVQYAWTAVRRVRVDWVRQWNSRGGWSIGFDHWRGGDWMARGHLHRSFP